MKFSIIKTISKSKKVMKFIDFALEEGLKEGAFHKNSTEVNGNESAILVKDEKTIIGVAIYYRWNDDCLWVNDIWVRPEYRSQGIGSQMLRMLMDVAKETQTELTLGVLAHNQKALQLYQQLGFKIESHTMCHHPENA